MLHGYKEYRLKNGITETTLEPEVKLLKSFIHFVNLLNQRKLEPYEIKPSDVRAFLEREKAKGLQGRTLRRKLSNIRQYFHYLWKIGKVPVDFMPKFEFEIIVPQTTATLFYEDYYHIKGEVLRHPKLLLNDKLYFLFSLYGFRMKDIERIRAADFKDKGSYVEMNYITSQDVLLNLKFKDMEEVHVILQAMERAVFRDHDYMVSSKKKHGFEYVRYNQKDLVARLNNVLPKPFKTEEVRAAYIFYLYKNLGKSFDEMVELLGVSPESFTATLKLVLERYKGVDYNKATN